MRVRLKRRIIRLAKKLSKDRRAVFGLGAACLVAGLIAYNGYMRDDQASVDPKSLSPLLNLIARAESRGNYNAHFGNASNTRIDFTSMTIEDVLKWQSDFVKKGNASSAVGKYQIVNTTLEGLVRELKMDTQQRFDPATQDKMAVALIERRGANDYVSGELTREEFAANLAKEWAALPNVTGKHPEKSYYAGDGLNRALVSVDEVLKALGPIAAKK